MHNLDSVLINGAATLNRTNRGLSKLLYYNSQFKPANPKDPHWGYLGSINSQMGITSAHVTCTTRMMARRTTTPGTNLTKV